MKNGTVWLDDAGNPIQAHGGMILKHADTYYWYGEHKGADNVMVGANRLSRVDVIGIACYSSANLRDWHYEGLALAAQADDPASILHPARVVERPKVIYNTRTGKFVLWFHADDATYHTAEVGIAISDSPTGPFTLIDHMRPNGVDSRDMTIFQDDDGAAYLFHSSDWNRTMVVARLNADYTGLDGAYVKTLIDQTREAPAIMKRDGTYYSVTSGCTGWAPNCALYATADNVMGLWRLIDNPCVGPNARITFYGQSTYIFNLNGTPYIMIDHWQPHDLKNSAYSILPIEFDELGMRIVWQREFCGIDCVGK